MGGVVPIKPNTGMPAAGAAVGIRARGADDTSGLGSDSFSVTSSGPNDGNCVEVIPSSPLTTSANSGSLTSALQAITDFVNSLFPKQNFDPHMINAIDQEYQWTGSFTNQYDQPLDDELHFDPASGSEHYNSRITVRFRIISDRNGQNQRPVIVWQEYNGERRAFVEVVIERELMNGETEMSSGYILLGEPAEDAGQIFVQARGDWTNDPDVTMIDGGAYRNLVNLGGQPVYIGHGYSMILRAIGGEPVDPSPEAEEPESDVFAGTEPIED